MIRILNISYYALTTIALAVGIVVGYNQLRIWQHSGQSYMSELLRLILIFVFAGCFLGGGVAHFLAFRIRRALPQGSGGVQYPTKLRKKFSWANSERIRLEAELKELKGKSVPTSLAPERKYSRSEIGEMPADILRKKVDTERGFKEQLEEAAQPVRPKEEG